MKKIDMHCDVIYKMLTHRQICFDRVDPMLDVTLPALQSSNTVIQCFAIFLPRTSRQDIQSILDGIDIYYRDIVQAGRLCPLKYREDLEKDNSGIHSLLSLEGVGALQGNLTYLRVLYYLGVRLIGVTWNDANWAADGVKERRHAGFSEQGRELIKECNRLGMIMDVSHLNETGFWELAEATRSPLIASHSNAYHVCPNPRNLKDEQIRQLIHMNGRIGITFVPWFVAEQQPSIADLIRHIDHICSLGGERHIGFGSDFDGIEEWIPGLTNPVQTDQLADALSQYYSDELIQGFFYKNWHRFLKQHLPSCQSAI